MADDRKYQRRTRKDQHDTKKQGPQTYTVVGMCKCGKYYTSTSTVSTGAARGGVHKQIRACMNETPNKHKEIK